jgi:hypothetical protein
VSKQKKEMCFDTPFASLSTSIGNTSTNVSTFYNKKKKKCWLAQDGSA